MICIVNCLSDERNTFNKMSVRVITTNCYLTKCFVNINFKFFPPGKSPFFQSLEDQTGLLDDSSSHLIDTSVQALTSPSRSSPHSQGSESSERFSRKVFVGGLPPDIDEGSVLIIYSYYSFNDSNHQLTLTCIFLFQMKSRLVSVDSVNWWLTGLIKLRASLISHQKDTLFFYFRYFSQRLNVIVKLL